MLISRFTNGVPCVCGTLGAGESTTHCCPWGPETSIKSECPTQARMGGGGGFKWLVHYLRMVEIEFLRTWNFKIFWGGCHQTLSSKNLDPGQNEHSHLLYVRYIHTYIFYLVSYTLYIDIVPNKFTIWQFSNVNWWLARVFFFCWLDFVLVI